MPSKDVIEVFEGKNGWFYRLRNRNRHILATSESFTRKATAVRMARNLAKRHPTFGAPVVL